MINRLLSRFDRTEYNKVSLPSSIIEKKKKNADADQMAKQARDYIYGKRATLVL